MKPASVNAVVEWLGSAPDSWKENGPSDGA
jgi:hypothetical protein